MQKNNIHTANNLPVKISPAYTNQHLFFFFSASTVWFIHLSGKKKKQQTVTLTKLKSDSDWPEEVCVSSLSTVFSLNLLLWFAASLRFTQSMTETLWHSEVLIFSVTWKILYQLSS